MQWATERLREYIIKGFVLDDDRLAEPGGIDYFDELLERIRAIRASEKRFYRKVRDIYALSCDYNPQNALCGNGIHGSGKIMRRVLKAKALGQDPGNISTLEE